MLHIYLPVRYFSPQLRVQQHHLLVAIGNHDLLTSGPTGTQSGNVLHINANIRYFTSLELE